MSSCGLTADLNRAEGLIGTHRRRVLIIGPYGPFFKRFPNKSPIAYDSPDAIRVFEQAGE